MQITPNTTIWLTGASSGIGKELALQLSRFRPTLILSARNIDKLTKTANLCKKNGAKTIIQPLDLENTNSIKTATAQIFDQNLNIDLLINNAGVSQRSLSYETSFDVDRKIMEINYFGTVLLTKLVLPKMIERRSGHIVVVSSLAGKLGFPLRSAYSASKHALHGFFETLAIEISKFNINVTIAIPSHIRTNIDINALTHNGEKTNKPDPKIKSGIPADKCAKKIIRAIEKNKYQVFIAGKDILAYYLHKISPTLYIKLIQKLNLK